MLKKYSRGILKTNTGEEAISILQSQSDIDFVMLDMKMPIMDGYEAARQIRKFNKEVVIIAQTAYALTGDSEKAIVAGCNSHITKPLLKSTLLETLGQYFYLEDRKG